MEASTKKSTFVPPWALATLLPWLGLAFYRALTNQAGAPGNTGAVLTGIFIAVLLLGIGLPYLVYRLANRSTQAGIITMIIVAAVGLVGQSGLLAPGLGGSSTKIVHSTALSQLIRASHEKDSYTVSEFEDALNQETQKVERKLSGDELIQTRAFHIMMSPYWKSSAELSRQGWQAIDTGIFPPLEPDLPISHMGDVRKALQRHSLSYKHTVSLCNSIIKTIDMEQSRAAKALVKAGYDQSKAKHIAAQFAKETAQPQRRALAEADLARWDAYRQLAGLYWSKVSDHQHPRGDDGKPLELEAARPLCIEQVKSAERQVEQALDELQNAITR
jgi:hypothetical protein